MKDEVSVLSRLNQRGLARWKPAKACRLFGRYRPLRQPDLFCLTGAW